MSNFLNLDFSDPEVYRNYFGAYPPGTPTGPTPRTGDTGYTGVGSAPRTTATASLPPAGPNWRSFLPKYNPNDFLDTHRAYDELGNARDSGTLDLPDSIYDQVRGHLKSGIDRLAPRHYINIGRQGVQGQVTRQLQDAGVDPGAYSQDILDELDFMEQGLPTGVDPRTIPSTAFGRGGVSRVLDVLNNRYRSKAQQQFRSTFPGDPYSSVPDTADDPFIDKIVGEQEESAKQGIERQKKRGALNEWGYADALSRLGQRKGQVRSRLQGRGSSLLDTIRSRAQEAYDKAEKGFAGSSITSPYDFSSARSQYDSAISSGLGGLEGSLRDLVSPDEFNLNELLGLTFSGQGPTNISSPILAALETRDRIKSNKRGLGSVGAF